VTSRGWWPHTDPSRLDSSLLTNTIAFITILIEESWEETRIYHQTCWCSRCCNSCTAAGNDKRYYFGACCKYRWALDSRQPSCWNCIDRYTQVRPAKLVSLRTMLCLLASLVRHSHTLLLSMLVSVARVHSLSLPLPMKLLPRLLIGTTFIALLKFWKAF
jgi:hypothetical protein